MRPIKPAARNLTPGKLRIIGGSLRGSRIEVADLDGLRPTSDRIRETLFNWLAPMIEGARCLDLFAGTGALGIEARSRGAGECVFVERDRNQARHLEATLARLKLDAVSVAQSEAIAWLSNAARPFDLVFLDPPFSGGFWAEAARKLEANAWLAANAWIYVEAPQNQLLELPANWTVYREGQAGEVRFALYRRGASSS